MSATAIKIPQSNSDISVGDTFWVPHETEAWLCGSVIAFDSGVLSLKTEKGIQKIAVGSADFKSIESCGSHIDADVTNLVDLDELSEGAILHHVRKRFTQKLIYTHVGAILVAVNPFEQLPIYTKAEIDRAASHTHPYPHVFVTAATAYHQLMTNSKNQSVLISGESGAGKTETTKKVLNYLATVAPSSKPREDSDKSIEERILQSNPLLEALGNAKTLRNNNSSRFGKWMKVDFDSTYRIQGCEIVNYLLEKSRVVKQSHMERNYHIFYQFLAGADPAMKRQLQLLDVDDYRYLDQSGCSKIDGVDDASEFADVLDALHILQFPEKTVENLFRILAGILCLGNLEFDAAINSSGADGCEISPKCLEVLNQVASLLGVDLTSLKFCLTEKMVQMGNKGSMVNIKMSPSQASESRDALARTLYGNMFDWVIQRINETLKTSNVKYSIGILDIFGFEVFELNSFEQLCINYANEKLQFHFNEVIFHEEMRMYADEGIPADRIVFVDNGECVNLIEGKPFGLLTLLDEECSLGNATAQSYISKIDKAFGKGKGHENAFFIKHRTKPLVFSVQHFAGAVEYNVSSFIEKNKDTLSSTVKETMIQSTTPLIHSLFSDGANKSNNSSAGHKGGGGTMQASKVTLGSQFRTQLIGFVQTLYSTEPHFIRCVKPNHAKTHSLVDGQLVLRQLRYAGLFEAIRIRKSGFSFRAPLNIFANSYQMLVDGVAKARQTHKMTDLEACKKILDKAVADGIFPVEAFFLGRTKVFLKSNMHRSALEHAKAERVHVFRIRIQSAARAFLARLKAHGNRIAKQRELQRLEAHKRKMKEQATLVQKFIRRFLVKRMMKTMHDLIDLRKALAARDVSTTVRVIAKMESSQMVNRRSRLDPHIRKMFQEEIDAGKTMVRLIALQDKFVSDMNEAMVKSDVAHLNKLLVISEQIGMASHPVVFLAKDEMVRMHKKRAVMKKMLTIIHLQDELDSVENIVDTLHTATELGVDPEFISKVQRIYDSAGPRMRVRNRLRRAIECVDRVGIQAGMYEAEKLQGKFEGFADIEMRAGRAMLRLLDFDYVLNTQRNSTLGSHPGDRDRSQTEYSEETKTQSHYDEGPRLTSEMLHYCNLIISAPSSSSTLASASQPDTVTKRQAKRILNDLCCNDASKLELVVRSFKWSKMLCVWKYPEVAQLLSESALSGLGHVAVGNDGRNESVEHVATASFGETFFGLRINEAHANLHLIRTLHHDVGTFGEAPASMQAAMGSMDLPSGVWETIRSLEQLDDYDLSPTSTSSSSRDANPNAAQDRNFNATQTQTPEKNMLKGGKAKKPDSSLNVKFPGMAQDAAQKLIQSR